MDNWGSLLGVIFCIIIYYYCDFVFFVDEFDELVFVDEFVFFVDEFDDAEPDAIFLFSLKTLTFT